MSSTQIQERNGQITQSQKVNKLGLFHTFLSSDYACFAIIGAFMVLLGIWDLLDHRIPNHDAAWHAIWSSNVRRFMVHPHDWNFSNLLALGKQHSNYPPGAWAFNGTLKVLFGDGIFADKACLMVQLAILGFSFYKLAMLTTASRVKSNAGLICMLCFPLVCALQRVYYIDFYHLCLFVALLASLAYWSKNSTWKNTCFALILMDAHILSKQSAVCYAGPLVAILCLYYLFWKKQVREAAQLFAIGLSGIAVLIFLWVIPNYAELSYYMQWRSTGLPFAEKALRIFENFKTSSSEILESAGPLFLCCALPLALGTKWKTIRSCLPALFAAIGGWLLIISIAYFNTPETRYFSPVLVPMALILGTRIGEGLESRSSWQRRLATALPILAFAQMLILCFQAAPLIKTPKPLSVNPIYGAFGIAHDSFLRSFLGYDQAGDPWKQKWIFDQIRAVEGIRYVWLNVLPSTTEFDQGSLIYLGQRLKNKSTAFPVSWRNCNADMSDSFKFSEQEFNTMDWFLVKTGNQGAPMTDEESKVYYSKALHCIKHSGDYELKAESKLPDGSILKLYRKDYAAIWNRNAKVQRAPN